MAANLRVASFNIRTSRGRDGRNRWRRRRETCIEAIRGFGAEIVGLQEVRPDQLADLQRAFADSTLTGAGRDADRGGEHVSVLIPRGEWTVESSETRWLSTTPARSGSRSWDADLPRVVTLVRCLSGATKLGVANTHFDHRSQLARARSAELIVRWLDEEPDRAWIVLGDLNDVPTSAPLSAFAHAGYRDVLADVPGGTEHAFTGANDRTRIDYILAGPGVRATAAWIGHDRPAGRLPSDHWPVLADLLID